MSDPIEDFKQERSEAITRMGDDQELRETTLNWMQQAYKYNYPYNFRWMDRPIIKFPQDVLALHEIIWRVKPDLIIETGIAHGGSIIFSASMLELLGGEREVVAVDIDIRAHNKEEIEKHPMFKRITMYQGSSTDAQIFAEIKKKAQKYKTIMVCLDSSHTHDHVLAELKLYAPLVSIGSYLVLPDTLIEYFPAGFFSRPWDKGNNPATALKAYLAENDSFEVDREFDNKLLITEAIGGYLKRIK